MEMTKILCHGVWLRHNSGGSVNQPMWMHLQHSLWKSSVSWTRPGYHTPQTQTGSLQPSQPLLTLQPKTTQLLVTPVHIPPPPPPLFLHHPHMHVHTHAHTHKDIYFTWVILSNGQTSLAIYIYSISQSARYDGQFNHYAPTRHCQSPPHNVQNGTYS